MLTQTQVQTDATAACRKHGARVVSDAACKSMSGNDAVLQAIGLGHCVGNLPALNLVMTTAYGLMSDEDQSLDLAQASIDAAKIGSAK